MYYLRGVPVLLLLVSSFMLLPEVLPPARLELLLLALSQPPPTSAASSCALVPLEDTSSRKEGSCNRGRNRTFEERFQDLLTFKSKFGHCNVPNRYKEENTSLGCWCMNLRSAYKHMKLGDKPRSSYKLTSGQVKILEDAGFQWSIDRPQRNKKTFEERIQDLTKYKSEYGDCDVPRTYTADPSLAAWCKYTRRCYKKAYSGGAHQGRGRGGKPHRRFSKEQFDRLEKIGFKWTMRPGKKKKLLNHVLKEEPPAANKL